MKGNSMRRTLPAVLVALVAALSLAACGDTVIDDGKAEEAIQQDVESTLKVKVSSVDCPGDVEVEVDKEFDCTVKSDAGDATVTLKILNEDADVRVTDFQQTK